MTVRAEENEQLAKPKSGKVLSTNPFTEKISAQQCGSTYTIQLDSPRPSTDNLAEHIFW
jgi:hypothetical protein